MSFSEGIAAVVSAGSQAGRVALLVRDINTGKVIFLPHFKKRVEMMLFIC